MGVRGRPGASGRLYAPPVPISSEHRLDGFDSGKPPLDDWLKTRALQNEDRASRTYVVISRGAEAEGEVVAYYALAYGSVVRKNVPRKIRHGLPDPAPVMILGRLAVDGRQSGNGIGGGMLREAMLRTLEASRIAGLRALIVHAIDDEAIGFYARYGFQVFPAGTRSLILPIETLSDSLGP